MKLNAMHSLLSIVVLFFSTLVYSQTYEGTIIKVVDGDTFVFQTTEGSLKVRMQGIDAPEKKQDFGSESKVFIEKYLNKPAKVESIGLDKYGRTLGTLLVNGIDINLESLKNGCSWHFKKYSTDINYSNAELSAKKALKGLWKHPNAIAPWTFRHL